MQEQTGLTNENIYFESYYDEQRKFRMNHIQGAEAKSVLYKNGTDALKNCLFSMKLYTYIAYCILFDISTAKS
jgi:hypothetical protein